MEMDTSKYLVFLVLVGFVLVTTLADTQSDDMTAATNEAKTEEDTDKADKRYGNLLSTGFHFGKKDDVQDQPNTETHIKENIKKWYYGTVLGRGLKAGKRFGEYGRTFDENKREDDYIDRDIERVDLDGPTDDKRWIGDILGTGYEYNKRRNRRDVPDKRFIHYFGRGLTPYAKSSSRNTIGMTTNDNDIDDLDDYDPEIETAKRYIGTNPGYRFSFGKRYNDLFGEQPTEDQFPYKGRYPVDKRFGYVLGRGFALGKRNTDLLGEQPTEVHLPNKGSYPVDKRFGYVLGRGFAFGKRNYDSLGEQPTEHRLPNKGSYPLEKRFGYVLGRGFAFGKRNYDSLGEQPTEDRLPNKDSYPLEKRFGYVLGRGYAFGKRNYDSLGEQPTEDHISNKGNYPVDKRFGYVLGRGYAFGKRQNDDRVTYGDLDGNTENVENPYNVHEHGDDLELDKRFGLVLGRGFLMGKRGSKRFGWILGRGLKFGKRSEGLGDEERGYFFDDNGHIENAYAKRFGYVLGSGYAFGKRNFNADADYIPDKRGFGFMLGRGFRLGRR